MGCSPIMFAAKRGGGSAVIKSKLVIQNYVQLTLFSVFLIYPDKSHRQFSGSFSGALRSGTNALIFIENYIFLNLKSKNTV